MSPGLLRGKARSFFLARRWQKITNQRDEMSKPNILWGVGYAGGLPVLLELRYIDHCRKYIDQDSRIWGRPWLSLTEYYEHLACEYNPHSADQVWQVGASEPGKLTNYPEGNCDSPGLYEDKTEALTEYAKLCEALAEKMWESAQEATKEND
jgi:hypothetical protein